MNQIQAQSILAKCLATENIDIIHDPKMETAAFDVKNRKLYLPVWQEMSKDLYDLLIGHEVGHAHETPEAGWHDTVIDNPQKKAFLNVVEDVRIERKVKARYPGLVKSFYKGYQELFDKDFFGIQDLDIQDLPLVDRVNLHYKIGHLLGVEFADGFEKDLVERIGKADTWAEVEKLADELYKNHQQERKDKQEEYDELLEKLMPHRFTSEGQQEQEERQQQRQQARQKMEDKKDALQEAYDKEEQRRRDLRDEAYEKGEDFDYDQFEDENGNDEHNEKYYDGTTRQDREDFYNKETELEKEEQADKATEAEDQKVKDRLDEIQKFLDEEGHSITDSNYRKNEGDLVDQDAVSNLYAKPFNDFDVEEVIVPMDELYDWNKCADLTKISRSEDYGWDESTVPTEELPGLGQELWKKYQAQQQPIINAMAQQFELRKAATGFKKSRISKTGKLNEDKLWAYKLTEDIFQQTQIVPNGKNHGILMYVDMSGSMHKNFYGTLQQMETVAMFCRKVNIPFDVYGFSSEARKGALQYDENGYVSDERQVGEEGRIVLNRHDSMVHILSSKANKKDWNNAMAYLQVIKICYMGYRYYGDINDTDTPYYGYASNRHFRLGSTPLNFGIIAGTEIAQRFQKRYNVEKLTTIFLTDGGATDYVTVRTEDNGRVQAGSYETKRLVIQDGSSTCALPQKSGYYGGREETTNTLLTYYKQKTGSTVINFHILESGKRYDFDREIGGYMDDLSWKKILKDKFTMFTPQNGYDARFLLKGKDDLKIKNAELEVKSNKKGDLLRGFRQFNKGKSGQRTFLNQIIELVA